MPPEWAPHAATWMAFPPAVYDSAVSLHDARLAWSEVARTISRFEPVVMLVRPHDRSAAEELLDSSVRYVELDLDDAWARDIGPTFVANDDGDVEAVDWRFNGWGDQSWANWTRDDAVAREVARTLGMASFRSTIVNEGGGIEVNGAGTVIATESVQLDPDRNDGTGKDEVEAALREALGVNDVLWLRRGLSGDYQEFATRGHVDLLAKFVDARTVLVHEQTNPDHPDFAVSAEIRFTLEAAGLHVVSLVAPWPQEIDGRLCDWSYVNCYFANGAVILGVYDDPADDAAIATLARVMPQREIVTVDARVLFALGGGVHCITQQEPEPRRR